MMDVDHLTVTLEFRPRPFWRPLGLRAFRRWYTEARHAHGRIVSSCIAFVIARRETFMNTKRVDV